MKQPERNKNSKRELLLGILRDTRPENDFERSTDFVGEGLLDSFDVITIVSAIEQKLGITIDGASVTPESFRNLDTLERLLASCS